jgi:hypothetical protein
VFHMFGADAPNSECTRGRREPIVKRMWMEGDQRPANANPEGGHGDPRGTVRAPPGGADDDGETNHARSLGPGSPEAPREVALMPGPAMTLFKIRSRRLRPNDWKYG